MTFVGREQLRGCLTWCLQSILGWARSGPGGTLFTESSQKALRGQRASTCSEFNQRAFSAELREIGVLQKLSLEELEWLPSW